MAKQQTFIDKAKKGSKVHETPSFKVVYAQKTASGSYRFLSRFVKAKSVDEIEKALKA